MFNNIIENDIYNSFIKWCNIITTINELYEENKKLKENNELLKKEIELLKTISLYSNIYKNII